MPDAATRRACLKMLCTIPTEVEKFKPRTRWLASANPDIVFAIDRLCREEHRMARG